MKDRKTFSSKQMYFDFSLVEKKLILSSIYWEKYWCACNRSTLCRYQGIISSVISLFWTREYEYTCACVDMQIGAHLSWTSRLLLSCSLTLLSCGQLINADYFFLLHIIVVFTCCNKREGVKNYFADLFHKFTAEQTALRTNKSCNLQMQATPWFVATLAMLKVVKAKVKNS